MTKIIKNINVFTKQGFKNYDIYFSKKINQMIEKNDKNNSETYLIPLFFDTHIHGGYGIDFNKIYKYNYTQIKRFIKNEKKEGVGKIFITTVSDSIHNLKKIALFVKKMIKNNSLFCGWHLEGPFISKTKSGAHNKKYIREIDEKFILWLKKYCKFPIIITFAPEEKNNLEIAYKYKNDFIWSLGHTNASNLIISKCFKYGFDRITHLCNAMPEFNHKFNEESIVNFAFLNKFNCEIIPDYQHVNKMTLSVIFNSINKNKLFIISDTLHTKGLKNGNYLLGNLKIKKINSICYLKNSKTLAGSNSKYDILFKKTLNITHNIHSTILASSINSYDYFHFKNYELGIKKDASFILIDNKGNIKEIYENGKRIR